MEKLGCVLFVFCELLDLCQIVLLVVDIDYEYKEGCGYFQICYGDYFDWFVFFNDGFFFLSYF